MRTALETRAAATTGLCLLPQSLRKRGIIIRYFGSQGGDLHNYIRISAGKPEHTDAVLAALKVGGPSTAPGSGKAAPHLTPRSPSCRGLQAIEKEEQLLLKALRM
jgi:hypothetical protein